MMRGVCTTWSRDGGQIVNLCGQRQGLELSVEPNIPPVNTVPQCGQIISSSEQRWGFQLSTEPCVSPVYTDLTHGDMVVRS